MRATALTQSSFFMEILMLYDVYERNISINTNYFSSFANISESQYPSYKFNQTSKSLQCHGVKMEAILRQKIS